MAIRPILRMGHPLLRRPADPVPEDLLGTPAFQTLLDDMLDTLKDSGGIGLAGPQIGECLRIALIDLPGGESRYGELPRIPSTFFVNPVLTVLDQTTAGFWEGCLSVPGLRGYVERPQALAVEAKTVTGEPLSLRFDGFAATVMQHEFDHLDGRLYIDRLKGPEWLMFEEEYERYVTGDR